jgi:tubulin alpha
MAASTVYRGSYVPKDICCAIGKVKAQKKIQFVDWCPTGFKCGINYNPNTYFEEAMVPRVDKTAYLLCNTTAIKSKFN